MRLNRFLLIAKKQDLKSCDHCDRSGSTPLPGTKNQSERGERERS